MTMYTNNQKNREFDKKATQNFCPEGAAIVERQGASEDENFEVKPTQSKTDSSDCLCIDQNLSFEAAYARLEEILEKMNSGKVSLEDSLKLYEEADKLIGWCSKRLSDAEKKIEILVKNREGELAINPQGSPEKQPFITPQPIS